jgi:membrane protein DedA with SNARE-associated domain
MHEIVILMFGTFIGLIIGYYFGDFEARELFKKITNSVDYEVFKKDKEVYLAHYEKNN